MKHVWVVVDGNESKPASERFKAFESGFLALQWAKSLGYCDALPLNETAGSVNYCGHGCDVVLTKLTIL